MPSKPSQKNTPLTGISSIFSLFRLMMGIFLLACFQPVLSAEKQRSSNEQNSKTADNTVILLQGFSNIPPVTVNDSIQVCEGSTVSGTVFNGDYDPEGGLLQVSSQAIQLPSHGEFQFNADGAFNYTPEPGYHGNDLAILSVCDGSAACSNDTLFLIINQWIPAIAGNDTSVCEATSVILSGNLPAAGIAAWSFTAGPAQPGLIPLNATTVLVEALIPSNTAYHFSYEITNGACVSADELIVSDLISPSASYAGADQYLCSQLPATAIMDAGIPSSGIGHWSVILGSPGIVFENPSDPQTLVSGIGAGMNIFDWTVTNGPCNASSSAVFIFITEAPQVYAGNDTTFCSTQSAYPLLNASVSANGELSWSSSGDGYFSDPSVIAPFYYPGQTDLEQGSTLLTLTLPGDFPCEAVSDEMLMTFASQSFVSAGPDDTVASGQAFELTAAAATNGLTILWSTSGDGSFNEPASLNPVYSPGISDLATGSVMLTINGVHPAGCPVSPDAMNLSFISQVYANAGPDQTSCMAPFEVNTASAGNYSSINWTHNGKGILENPGSLAPVYHPSSEDTGSVQLVLKAVALPPSTDTVTDSMLLLLRNPSGIISGQSVVCEGESAAITFDLSGSAPWTLTYTDGLSSYERNGIMTSSYYEVLTPGAGTHIYTMTALEDRYCPSVEHLHGSAEIRVNPHPSASFEILGTCSGAEIIFLDRSVNPDSAFIQSRLWNFGDPAAGNQNSSTDSVTIHNYLLHGVYTASLKIINNAGCSDEISQSLSIHESPIPSFAWAATTVANTIEFRYQGSQASTYEWNFGDGNNSSLAADPGPFTHQFPATGTYTTSLLVTDQNGCQGIAEQEVHVGEIPGIMLRLDETEVCPDEPLNVQMQVSGTSGNWTLDWGDGSTPVTETAPVMEVQHAYAQAGIYTLTARLFVPGSDLQTTDSITKQIRVHSRPAVTLSIGNRCEGTETAFYTSSDDLQDYRYSWDFGVQEVQSDTSALSSPRFLYTKPGDYPVRLVVMNHPGCSDTLIETVLIREKPAASFLCDAACSGKPVTFRTDNKTGDNEAVEWKWSIQDQGNLFTSSGHEITFTFPQSGNYPVNLIVTNQYGCKDSISKILRVDAPPLSVFLVEENYRHVQGNVQMKNGSAGSIHYSWDFGNGTTSEETEPVAHYTENGTYTIELIARTYSGCTDTSRMIYTQMFKGLYIPNAFARSGSGEIAGDLWKPAGENLGSYQVEVYNRQGQLLWSSDKLDEKGSPAEGWDGTYRGMPCDPGIYVWKISAVFRDGTPWKNRDIGNRKNMPDLTTGTISLIR